MTNPSNLRVRVAQKSVEAEAITSFELVSLQGDSLPAFSAGSHIDVFLPSGLVRQYSLCNTPGESERYLIAVLRDPHSRGGSIAMHNLVREGDEIQISVPKNHFALTADAHKSLLLAGGIGVTPILCMAERLAHTGAAFEMHYCTRTFERTAFVDRILNSPLAHSVHFHFDDGPDKQRFNVAATLLYRGKGTHLYVCGPTGYMNSVLSTARQCGWPEEQIHFEYFAMDKSENDADSPFEVMVASSGEVVSVLVGQTVVQALAAAGVIIPTSCEQGVCDTCITRVLEGVPHHRDVYLTKWEQDSNDQFLPCCSRARTTRLVLDL